MLRRRARAEILAEIFSEAGRRSDGGLECDAGVFAARRGGDTDAEQKAARGAVSARCGGWLKRRGAVRRAELLPHAPEHRDSETKARRRGCRDRSRRVFWAASEPGPARTAVPPEPVGDCACGGFTGSHALALRCAGLYGVRHARLESDR